MEYRNIIKKFELLIQHITYTYKSHIEYGSDKFYTTSARIEKDADTKNKIETITKIAAIGGTRFMIEVIDFMESCNFCGEKYFDLRDSLKQNIREFEEEEKIADEENKQIAGDLKLIHEALFPVFPFLYSRKYYLYFEVGLVKNIEEYLERQEIPYIGVTGDYELEKYKESFPKTRFVDEDIISDVFSICKNKKDAVKYSNMIVKKLNILLTTLAANILRGGEENEKPFARDLLSILSNMYETVKDILRDITE